VERDKMIKEMMKAVEKNGAIKLSGLEGDFYIQSIDDKEGYSYVTSDNREFEYLEDAMGWALHKLHGVENIKGWE
jgi:hypothetical protein